MWAYLAARFRHLAGAHTWVYPIRDPEVAWCRVCGISRIAVLSRRGHPYR